MPTARERRMSSDSLMLPIGSAHSIASNDYSARSYDSRTIHSYDTTGRKKRLSRRLTHAWPEDRLRFRTWSETFYQQWNKWTYSYMDEILAKGSKQMKKDGAPLRQEDLFHVPKKMKSQNLADYYFKYSNRHPSSTPYKRLLKTLWKIAGPIYIPAGICELVVVICGAAMPLLARELLVVLEKNQNQSIIEQGLPFSIAIFCITLINGLANHRHRHMALKTGVTLRAAVVNIIYQHLIMLSPSSKQELTSGQVMNLVAVDAQKVYEVTQEGHLIWALPMSVALVSYFLIRTLGLSTLVGIAVLVLFVPLMERITARIQTVRKMRVRLTDERVEIVSDMLQGIRVTKLNHYEESYKQRTTDVRIKELNYLARELTLWATGHLMTATSPLFATAATFATYVLVNPSNILTASDIFGVLLLFTALRFPIKFFGRLIGKAGQALSAIRRISDFLSLPLRKKDANGNLIDGTDKTIFISEEYDVVESDDEFDISESEDPMEISFREKDENCVLRLVNASYQVGGFAVKKINLKMSKGDVVAICGPVGSGKTTLLNGILEEAHNLGGKTRIYNRKSLKLNKIMSYAPQTPFLLHETVRNNILFGAPMNWSRYQKVLDACCLRPDLERLENGDMTVIGGRGVTLSGGQKQRISLARVAYTPSPLVILDDPFSALDAETGKVIFEELIASSGALLEECAVLLVTHAAQLITHPKVKEICLMVDGRSEFQGSFDELMSFHPSDKNILRAVEHIQSSTREEHPKEEQQQQNKGGNDNSDEDHLILLSSDDFDFYSDCEDLELSDMEESMRDVDPPEEEKNVRQRAGKASEEKESGLPRLRTWLVWFRHAGGIQFTIAQVVLMATERIAYTGLEWFLAKWSDAADGPVTMLGREFPPQYDGLWAQAQYLRIYPFLLFLCAAATFIRCEWAVAGGRRASRNVFFTMLSSVLRAPMSYFEKVPMGTILNRFTYDTDVNDILLAQNMSRFMNGLGWYVAGVAIQFVILPWTAIAIIPVSITYMMLLNYYRMSGPDLQRLDAATRSPIQCMLSECLEGSTCIRVFSQSKSFVKDFYQVVDANSSALLNFVSAQRWLGVRIEMMGSLVVLVSSVLVVFLNDVLGIPPGMVGVLMLWSFNFTVSLNFLMDTYAETEAAIMSIERVDAMAHLPAERPMETDSDKKPPPTWPEKGSLEFIDVCMRYREDLPLALNKLSFSLPEGKSCGIVGRTGAGKSSITAALFRLTELQSGSIKLDGVDLSSLGLSDVRGRGMDIIPQDPFLTGATLRECLDPLGKHSDEAIWESLRAVRMDGEDVSLSLKLAEGGSNFSVGQRQLVNLSRALLSQPKVLVLDEATASIDGETDAFIQSMLRTRFPNTTLITVAHRLNTIMDYDFVLVMDAGHAVEYGPPYEILQIPNGVFSELVDSTGQKSSAVLREMALEAYFCGDDEEDKVYDA